MAWWVSIYRWLHQVHYNLNDFVFKFPSLHFLLPLPFSSSLFLFPLLPPFYPPSGELYAPALTFTTSRFSVFNIEKLGVVWVRGYVPCTYLHIIFPTSTPPNKFPVSDPAYLQLLTSTSSFDTYPQASEILLYHQEHPGSTITGIRQAGLFSWSNQQCSDISESKKWWQHHACSWLNTHQS